MSRKSKNSRHSEKYLWLGSSYSAHPKSYYRPEKYGTREAKGCESGKAERCKRKAAWFDDGFGGKHGTAASAYKAGFSRMMRALGYSMGPNRTWARDGLAVVVG